MTAMTVTEADTIRREWAIDALLDHLDNLPKSLNKFRRNVRIVRDADRTDMAYVMTEGALYTIHVYGVVSANVTVAYFDTREDSFRLDFS